MSVFVAATGLNKVRVVELESCRILYLVKVFSHLETWVSVFGMGIESCKLSTKFGAISILSLSPKQKWGPHTTPTFLLPHSGVSS